MAGRWAGRVAGRCAALVRVRVEAGKVLELLRRLGELDGREVDREEGTRPEEGLEALERLELEPRADRLGAERADEDRLDEERPDEDGRL